MQTDSKLKRKRLNEIKTEISEMLDDREIRHDKTVIQIMEMIRQAQREAKHLQAITAEVYCPIMSYRQSGIIHCVHDRCAWWNRCRKIIEDV